MRHFDGCLVDREVFWKRADDMFESIVRLRQDLHRYPELSGREAETANRIKQFFAPLNPDQIVEGLGGNGLAIVFSGKENGPTVLLRCELDALPILEPNPIEYRSRHDGVAHKCGHDGHMAILAAVGAGLSIKRPERGKVVLLFQPAEETGNGAAAVVDDPRFSKLKPDFSFALHNLPGFSLGQIVVRDGTFNCASRGMIAKFSGVTAHAAQPETGLSPATAMARVIQRLVDLPEDFVSTGEVAFVTVVGATLGEKAFGTAPGNAEVWATLRCETDDTMSKLVNYAEQIVKESASQNNLSYDIQYEDVFEATVNSKPAVDLLTTAIGVDSIKVVEKPFRWSEDFGQISALSEGALFGIGAGLDVPDLHNPYYDFPDELIPLGADVFGRILDTCFANPAAP